MASLLSWVERRPLGNAAEALREPETLYPLVCAACQDGGQWEFFVSFGAELQQERLKRDMTLESISDSTKVAMRYLRALEEDTYAKLPGGVFNRGIVRSYCRCLNLNEDEWLQRFNAYARSEGEADWTEFAQNVKRNRVNIQSRNRLRWLGVALMLLVLIIVVAVVLQLYFGVNLHLPFLHKAFPNAAVARALNPVGCIGA